MKKIKLFPIIGLTSIIGTAMPLVSCNNSKQNIWYTNDAYLNSLTIDDVGTTNFVKIGNLKYRVRLIDVDKDKDINDNTIHTTWEFADVICDRNGYSLSTFWNDTNTEIHPCADYFNSSIRWALVGKGNPQSHGWYEKGGKTKSTTYTQPVIDMLPSDLQGRIKNVKKLVFCWDAEQDKFVVQPCTDKLFILSSGEMFDETSKEWVAPQTELGSEYAYYANYVWQRVFSTKGQIAGKTDQSLLIPTEIEDALTESYARSLAGYACEKTSFTGYYLRDVLARQGTADYGFPAGAGSQGGFCYGYNGDGNTLAAPIAPAFCL